MEEKPKYTTKMAMDQIKEGKEKIQYMFDKNPLTVLKLFYFFALSALSLKVVYMPLYFKQVGLPASYAGVLAGLPPFIRGGGALFLGILSDKLKKRRTLFLISLVANMVIPLLCLIPRVEYPVCDVDFTEEPVTDPLGMPLAETFNPDGSIKTLLPPSLMRGQNGSALFAHERITYSRNKNATSNGLTDIKRISSSHHRFARSARVKNLVTGKSKSSENLGIFEFYRRTSGRLRSDIPTQDDASRENEKKSKEPSQTKQPHKKTPQESHDMLVTIFLTLLFLLIIGEFLGGPLRSLADLSVLESMGGDKSNYGDVALWMQVGKIFLAPLILVLIRSYPLHVCDSLKDNYENSLYPLSAFIAFSMIFGFSIRFKGDDDNPIEEDQDDPNKDKTLVDIIFTFKTFTILILSFFAGGLSAVHYTFIFWYLTDLSPKDSAMVIAVVIVLRDIVSSISYKMSGRTLGLLGPVNTLHVALLLYIISFLSYAVMENPWFAIIPEIIQYIVFPLAYSSFVVYLGQNTPAHLNATVQGIYQCLYYGVGFGCGPIMAGVLFEHVGGANTFLIFSGISFALLLFSLARHVITRHFDNESEDNYKKIPEEDENDEEVVDAEY